MIHRTLTRVSIVQVLQRSDAIFTVLRVLPLEFAFEELMAIRLETVGPVRTIHVTKCGFR